MASNIFSDPSKAAQAVHDHCGGGPGWYAGITDNPPRRLFSEHGVDQDDGTYCAVECVTDDVARDAEVILLAHGYEGGPRGGDDLTVWVYAYEITDETCEKC